MSVFDLIAGTAVELVGVEDNGDGGLRLYLNHRAYGTYALVYDDDAKAAVRSAWAGGRRVTIPTPPLEAIYSDDPPTQEAAP